jgi:Regulator of chromosome condensation (RCC1) repeat
MSAQFVSFLKKGVGPLYRWNKACENLKVMPPLPLFSSLRRTILSFGLAALALLMTSRYAHAGNGNAIDRIDFGNLVSESAHNFMPGADPSTIAKAGVGAFGQTYRLPYGTGSSDPTGSQVLTFTVSCDPVKQNYITVKLWGSDRNIMMFLLDQNGNNDVPFGDVGLDTFAGHGGPPTFPNRFFYYTLEVPIGLTQGKNSVTLSLLTAESWNRYSSVKLQPMTKGTAGRPVYSALIHLDPCYNPDPSEVVGVAPITTGQITNYPTISTTQGLALIQNCRSNLFLTGNPGSIPRWIDQQIWTNNYMALTNTNYAPPPPETMGLALGNAVPRLMGCTSADAWRDIVARWGCAYFNGYCAVPGEMVSAFAAAYVMPPFTNAAGAVVPGLDRYHDPELLLRTVKGIDASTYLIDVGGGFCQQANQSYVLFGDAWTGLTSTPRKAGTYVGTTARQGTIHGGGDLQGSGAYHLGWAICTLLNDTNGATNGRSALMAYLDPTKATNSFDADFSGTNMPRVYAWERMLFQNVNWYAYATGGTTSQNQFEMLGMYANWVALCRLQELYPNTNYVVKWDASNSTYMTPNYLGTNSPLQAAEMVSGIIPTTLRGSYVSGFTNYAMTAKGLGEGGGALACGFDGGAYGQFIGQFPLMISQIAAWDTVNVDTNLLASFARQVNAAHDAFQQLICPLYYITNPVTSGMATNAHFTFGPEDFITWRSFENLNDMADGFSLNLNWASAGTNGVVNNAYMRRAAYLQIQYTGGGAPGDPVNAAYYEQAVRGLMGVDPTTLKALPNEPNQPDFVWYDPQAQSVAFHNNGERFFLNANWRRGPGGSLTQIARIHHTRPNIDTGATVMMPYDSTTVQSDGNLSSTNLFDRYVVRYGDYLIAFNSSSSSNQIVKLPPGYGQAKDLISSNYYNLGSTVTVGPSNAAVLWLAASNAPSGLNAPILTSAAMASATNITGTTVNLSVAGTNPSGGTPSYIWSLAGYPPAAVSFSANSNAAASNVTATFTAAGTYTFNALLTNGTGITNSTVTVSVAPTVTSLVLNPTNVLTTSFETPAFAASVYDQFRHLMSPGASINWYMISGTGALTPDGIYHPVVGSAGSAVLGASVGGASATATVSVVAPVGVFSGSTSVGAPTPLGSSTLTSLTNGGSYTLKSGTGDVWNPGDNFQFAWTNIIGDAVITARVKGITNTSNIWAKAGVMFRHTLATNGAYAFCFATPLTNNGVAFQTRYGDGSSSYQSSSVTNGPGVIPPEWVRLTRTGDTFEAYYAPDNNGVPGTWSHINGATIGMNDPVCVGLAFSGSGSSYSSNSLPTAYFDNVTITTPSVPTIFPTNEAIGSSSAGAYLETLNPTNAASNTVTLTGQGGDIYGTSDAVQYAFKSLVGDGTLTARVVSFSSANTPPINPTKVGVMMRETDQANSKEFCTVLSSANAMRSTYRSSTGGSSTEKFGSGTYSQPYWVRVVRTGTNFSSYASPNGLTWSQVGTTVGIPMSTVNAGLVVASLDANNPCTATFDNISFVGSTNTAPVITVAPSAQTNSATNATLSVTVTDDGGPSNLTYTWYPVGQSPGSVTFGTNNGSVTGNNVSVSLGAPGVYSFEVAVTDILGATTTARVSLGGQVITFPAIAPVTYSSNGTVTLGASANSGLPISYSALTTNVYVSASNQLTILGAGTATIVAYQWGNTNWPVAAPVTNQVVITPASQTIAPLGIITAQIYNPGATVTVTPPVASSGLPVTLAVVGNSPATISGNVISLTGTGTVTVAANQAGNGNYQPAAGQTTSFAVYPSNLNPQTITFAPITSPQTYGNGPMTLSGSASSGLPVTFSSSSGIASISGNVLTILGAGSTTITATQAGDTNNLPVSSSQSLIINRASNVIGALGTIADQTFSNGLNIGVTTPTASSGLPVFLGVRGPATFSGGIVSVTGAGTVTVTATQPGNNNYLSASNVSTSFLVIPGSQSLSFAPLPALTYSNNATFTLSATASSGLPVSYFSSASNVVSISSNVASLTGAGTATITAFQPGNSNWNAASPVNQILSVAKGSNAITGFPVIGTQNYTTNTNVGYNNIYTLTNPPTASSGLPVTLSIKSGPATISSNTMTFTGTGTVTLAADQPGNANFPAATQVTTSFPVQKYLIPQTITFPPIANQPSTTNTIPLLATASSGLPVSYTNLTGPVSLVGSNALKLSGIGTISVTAVQSGDSNYAAAASVTNRFTVTTGSQTITFQLPTNSISVTNKTFSVTAISSSGLPVTITSSATNVVSVGSNNTLILRQVGITALTASQPGNARWQPAVTTAPQYLTVTAGANTITPFGNFATNITFSQGLVVPIPAPLPTASSGLPVQISVTSGPALMSGTNAVRVIGAGTVTLQASQSGNTSWAAAPPISSSFTVAKGSQTITPFASIADRGYASAPFLVALPTASSGLQTVLSVVSGPATVSGNALTMNNPGVTPGLVTLAANQSGNTNYNSAPQITTTFSVYPSNMFPGVGTTNPVPSNPPTLPSVFPLTRAVATGSGSVTAWGDNTYGQTNVPVALANVIQVAAGDNHNVALRANGTVVAWGLSTNAQTTLPAGLANVVQVTAGTNFSSALLANGRVISWGNNAYGQTNVPVNLSNVVQIAAGSYHELALRADGTIVAWGATNNGRTAVPADATNVVQIAAGERHSVALKADGTVEAWGDNSYGQTNVPALSNAVRISSGSYHTAALRADGSVVVWGDNSYGQTNVPVTATGISQVAAGGDTVFAVTTNGVLVSWGDTSHGKGTPPAGVSAIRQFILGLYHALGLK